MTQPAQTILRAAQCTQKRSELYRRPAWCAGRSPGQGCREATVTRDGMDMHSSRIEVLIYLAMLGTGVTSWTPRLQRSEAVPCRLAIQTWAPAPEGCSTSFVHAQHL